MGGGIGRIGAGIATGGLSEVAGLGGVGPYAKKRSTYSVDPGPKPVLGPYSSLRDKESGLLANPNYRLNAGPDINLNTQGLEQIRGRALSTAPSTWAGLMNQRQAIEEAQARSGLSQSAGSAQAQARAQLASRRGLGGGSAERLARGGARDLMAARQQAAQKGAGDRMNTALEDEKMRMDLLKSLPQMELAALDPQFKNKDIRLRTEQYNIDQALRDKYAEDQYNALKYQEDMKAYAAAQQANAIGAAGGGKKG